MPTRLMPFCLLALLLSLPVAQPLRADDAPGDSKVHQELRAFVDGMYAKVKSTGPAAIGLFIDNDAAKARVKGHYPRSSIKMPVLVEALIPLAVRRAAAERHLIPPARLALRSDPSGCRLPL